MLSPHVLGDSITRAFTSGKYLMCTVRVCDFVACLSLGAAGWPMSFGCWRGFHAPGVLFFL